MNDARDGKRARPVWRVAAVAIAVVFGVLATATARELSTGSRAVAEADAAIVRGDQGAAIAAARAAAEAVVPGSPYPTRGYERLEGLGRDAEARGDDATALAAWQAMRSAAVATHGVGVRTQGWLALANDSIVRVGAGAAPSSSDPSKPRIAARLRGDALLDSLQRSETPASVTFALLAAGSIALFGGVARIAWLASRPLSLKGVTVASVVALAGGVVYALVCLRG